jgi:hypothetical protein
LEIDGDGRSWSEVLETATISLLAPVPDFISVAGNIVTFSPTPTTSFGPHSYTIRQEAAGCTTKDTTLSVTVVA